MSVSGCLLALLGVVLNIAVVGIGKMPEPRTVEEWADRCDLPISAGTSGKKWALCLDCARAYASQCVTEALGQAIKAAEDGLHPIRHTVAAAIRDLKPEEFVR